MTLKLNESINGVAVPVNADVDPADVQALTAQANAGIADSLRTAAAALVAAADKLSPPAPPSM